MYYQKEYWRVYYDEMNPLYEQFKTNTFMLSREDPREDHKLLNFTSDDTVLAITQLVIIF